MTGASARLASFLIPALALALLAVAIGVLWADLAPDERRAVDTLLTPPRLALAALFALAFVAILALLAHRLVAATAGAARRISEAVRLITHGNPAHRVTPSGVAELRAIAEAVNELASNRMQLLADVDAAIAKAKAGVEDERNRLAALIGELDQSVLVCNRDGRVLLYNAAAESLLGAAGDSDAGGVGLGRSVFEVMDRAVVLHAVEALERQLGRGVRESTHFVTATSDGRLLRARAAPVVSAAEDTSPAPELSGYVLLLADVTAEVDNEARRVTLFHGLVEAARAALASIRAAIENLTEHPEMDVMHRTRFATIIRDEAVRLSDRLHGLTRDATLLGLKERWPLEEVRAEDLLTLARSRIERRVGIATRLDEVDPALWLRVDSFSLARGLTYVAQRLKEEFRVRELRFRLSVAGGHAQLDAVWQGPPLSSETAFGWLGDPFTLGGEDSPLTLAQVMERHGGEAWYQRDVPEQAAYFRFLLPLADVRAPGASVGAQRSRPEFYDFDLFRRSPATEALDERPLTELAYTVFDTETTGLAPGEGDEIIAIGAVRIVNGRVLPGESFETLVDPRRTVPAASVAVHGITPTALAGQPTIDAVLPRLRRFAEDTVLVGHNVAFDMRFLQLKQAQTGVRFEQPVLDTLLLSAVVHPAEENHSLEEIAARLGVSVIGRHTAAGDARVTAEVFLRLLPLLVERGIRTLAEARAASEKTYYARLRY
jgi:DNA polymerase-3 subunit epsilon